MGTKLRKDAAGNDALAALRAELSLFEELGAEAKSAVPGLKQVLAVEKDSFVQSSIKRALSKMGE